MALHLHFSLCFDEIQQKDACLTLTRVTGIMSPMKTRIVLVELHKLWTHHANHLKEMHQRNEHMDHQISKSNPKSETGQPVMVKKHTHCTFKPKYLLD